MTLGAAEDDPAMDQPVENQAIVMKLVAASCLLSLAICRGQTPPSANFESAAQEVLLDVVVRDKKGQRVANLEPAEVTVFDNGVPRKITSFRLNEGGDVRLVTLIYNRLDLESRSLARKASLDFLRTEIPPNVFMSVLVLDDGVRAVQAFTQDRALLKTAVEHAAAGTAPELRADSRRIEADLRQQLTGGAGDPAGAPMAQMMLNMLSSVRGSEMAQTINIVSQQYTSPGRKSILFFSTGLAVPQGMDEQWKTLLSTANRFNVSFYAIDSRGISTARANAESVSETQDAASASRSKTLTHGNGLVTPAMVQAQEMTIAGGKANGQNRLAELADATGGFLIANTNDFRNDMRKVSEDIESYYQLTYNPQIEKYDGSFRKVEVRSTRPNLHIQSRAGYLALPASAVKDGVVSSSRYPRPREFLAWLFGSVRLRVLLLFQARSGPAARRSRPAGRGWRRSRPRHLQRQLRSWFQSRRQAA